MLQLSWFDEVLTLAREAGLATLRFHPSRRSEQAQSDVSDQANSNDMNVRQKADASPVTEADLQANQIIVDGLSKISPDIPIVSEECPGSERFLSQEGQFWLVDPLDGTRGFVAGDDEYTVNLALIDQGVSVWGVVYAPISDRLYWGGAQMGSRLSAQGEQRALQLQTLSELPTVTRVLASKAHLGPKTVSFVERLGNTEMIRIGSSLKLCLIAQGQADLYPRLGLTSQWDIAAAQAVLEGAGGTVCDLHGKPLRYGQGDLENPYFVASRIDYAAWQHLVAK